MIIALTYKIFSFQVFLIIFDSFFIHLFDNVNCQHEILSFIQKDIFRAIDYGLTDLVCSLYENVILLISELYWCFCALSHYYIPLFSLLLLAFNSFTKTCLSVLFGSRFLVFFQSACWFLWISFRKKNCV